MTSTEANRWAYLNNDIILYSIKHRDATPKEVLDHLKHLGRLGRPRRGILEHIKNVQEDTTKRMVKDSHQTRERFTEKEESPLGSNPFMENIDLKGTK